LPKAQEALDSAERFRQGADRLREGVIGSLRIACVTSALYDVLPMAIRHFRSTRPHVDVDLWETDTAIALNAIREGRADFGLVRTDRVQDPLRLRLVRSDRFVVAIPEGHPLTRKRVVSIGMLRGWPVCVTRRSVSPIFHDNVMRLFLDHGGMPEKLVETGSLLAQLGVVACGLAGALVPMSTKRLRMPGVVFRDLKESSSVIELSTVWNEEKRSLLIDAFLDSIDVAMAASPQLAAWEKG
jgi:DNA-binding transcriptional LysR family regulator